MLYGRETDPKELAMMLIQANYSILIKQERVLDTYLLTQQFQRDRPTSEELHPAQGKMLLSCHWSYPKQLSTSLYSFKNTNKPEIGM